MNEIMKTVFYINCTDTGSTGKIIQNTAAILRQRGWKSILCAATLVVNSPVHDKQFTVSNKLRRAITYRVAKITGNRFGMSWGPTRRLIKEILEENPDVVHIHCANGSFINIYQMMRALKKNKIPTVITNHAEFFYTGNCDHAYECDGWRTGCGCCPQKLSLLDTTRYRWKAMRNAIASFPQLVVTSVSPWVLSRSAASPIMCGVPQQLVENGVDTAVFRPYVEGSIWQKYGISSEGKRIVLYVTACFYGNRPEKGSQYLIELARRFVGEEVVFVVAGSHAENINVPENVYLMGRITDQYELANMYSAADLTLITSERETFSMPVAESLCCGTPVVGFRAGGPESIALEEFSEFVDFADVDALEKVLRTKWIQFKTPERAEQIYRAAVVRYSEMKMAEEYLEIYEALIGATANE